MKKILPYILFFSLFAYLIIVLTFATVKLREVKCCGVQVVTNCSDENAFIDEVDVLQLIKRYYGDLEGVDLIRVDKDSIERLLNKNAMVKSAEVYYRLDGYLHIGITPKKPVLRVISDKGYYVDEEGGIMPLSRKHTSRVVVATGRISEHFACNKLYPFVMKLREDRFWDAMIEQIVVEDLQEVVLIPKVGNFRINLGELEMTDKKLENLRLFLRKGIVLKGWNKYKEIHLKYEDQIVCVKR